MAPPAGRDELLDPGNSEHRLRGPGQQPQHTAAGPRSDDAAGCDFGLRIESREEREGQREGETLQSVQQEEAVKEEEEQLREPTGGL